MGPRETFKLIYKVGMILVTVGLAVGAVAAWWSATPRNGLLLIAGILALLTLMAGLSINKLEWQDQQAETYRGILDEARARFGGLRATGPDSAGKVTFALGGGAPVSVEYAEPEVHRVDAATLEEAKRMAADGAAIDDICRMIDPEFDARDELHRGAFRRLAQAMIEQG